MTDATPAPNAPPLTLFEGKQVTDTVVKVTGTVKHVFAKPARDLRQDESIVTVAVFKVGKIAFPPGDDGCTREQTIEVVELHEMSSEVEARRFLSEARGRTRREVEARYGEAPPGSGITVRHGTPPTPDDEAKAARDRMRSVSRGEAADG
jgi:hypothetical protein